MTMAEEKKELSANETAKIGSLDWLKEHIHKYGCRYNADEIMHMATGEAFDPNYYLDYLEDKYTKLYHLD